MDIKKSFLGTGWAFPPEFVKEQKQTKMISNEEDIKSSLHILLTTRLGERIMLPNYGCNLEALLFESLNRTLITYTVDLIKTAILYHEPRIDVIKIDISETDPLEGKLIVSIDYIVRATNSRTNMVFPFYKEEGTNI
ncbi:GPW/gp25 family protein [Mariniflexile sp. AS56]|uniref:GPW/gp25 family protein n=1 Tax=Mariniflexile sp. AS56 TaxID=3063957 RepID=UPI0026E956B3|nr:GPW/gp25 family protein [Mariniflexile sp. AS56]MDO7174061.1 GPW/gp25 family protein [Mariniflexile sp. AS56]